MTTGRIDEPSRAAEPTVAEIAALTRRLRELSAAGRQADPAERAAVLADKQALLDRITAATTTDLAGGGLVGTDTSGRVTALTPGEPGYRAAAAQFDTEAVEARLRYELLPAHRTAVFLAQAQQAVADAITRHGVADPAALDTLHEETENATHALAHPPAHQPGDQTSGQDGDQGRAQLAGLLDPDQAPTARAHVLDAWNAHVAEHHQAQSPRQADRHAALGADKVAPCQDVQNRGERLDDPVAAMRHDTERDITDAADHCERWDTSAESDRDELTDAGAESALGDVLEHDTVTAVATASTPRPDDRAGIADRLTELTEQGLLHAYPDPGHDPHGVGQPLGWNGDGGDPVQVGPTVTAEHAARQLADTAGSLAQARQWVSGYLHEASARAGVSLHQWGLDRADLAELHHRLADTDTADQPGQARRERAHVLGTGNAHVAERHHTQSQQQPEPGQAELPQAELPRTELGRAELGRAEWGRAEPEQRVPADPAGSVDREAVGGVDPGRRAAQPVLLEGMRQQVTRIEAALSARTAPDNPAELADRIARLRDRLADRADPADPMREAGESRREQLNRWHADDTTTGDSTTDGSSALHAAVDGHADFDEAGWSR